MRHILVPVGALLLTSCAHDEGRNVRSTIDRYPPRHTIIEGWLRVVGDVRDDGPCVKLASTINAQLEGGLRECNYVELQFIKKGFRVSKQIFDLWLVSGPTSWTDPENNPVVDFYERVTLNANDAPIFGRYEVTTYRIHGQEISILEGAEHKNSQIGGQLPG